MAKRGGTQGVLGATSRNSLDATKLSRRSGDITRDLIGNVKSTAALDLFTEDWGGPQNSDRLLRSGYAPRITKKEGAGHERKPKSYVATGETVNEVSDAPKGNLFGGDGGGLKSYHQYWQLGFIRYENNRIR